MWTKLYRGTVIWGRKFHTKGCILLWAAFSNREFATQIVLTERNVLTLCWTVTALGNDFTPSPCFCFHLTKGEIHNYPISFYLFLFSGTKMGEKTLYNEILMLKFFHFQIRPTNALFGKWLVACSHEIGLKRDFLAPHFVKCSLQPHSHVVPM